MKTEPAALLMEEQQIPDFARTQGIRIHISQHKAYKMYLEVKKFRSD